VEHASPADVTLLLQKWQDGHPEALDALIPLVYKELRRVAHAHLRNERSDHTLQTAALVNEAYLRLVGIDPPHWESRTHFFAIAGRVMRQILVDYARRHRAGKRGAGACRVSLDDVVERAREQQVDVVALDDALEALTALDPRQAQVVELRFFAGMSLQDISAALGIAPATVQRDWTAARAWLHREMSRNSRA
jgi:RNA polymerase sigma factor (TIGR02999 family)